MRAAGSTTRCWWTGSRPSASRASPSTSPTAIFETPRRRFILADAPGHEQYTRNMVTGASASDVAVLLVDARKGLLVQTRRHAAIASLLGIRQVMLAVNKMDLVGFDQRVFDRIVTDFYALLGKLGPLAVTAIPVCARDGDNVTAPSTRMPWYSGTTLLRRWRAPSRTRTWPSARSACRCSLCRGRTARFPRLCRHGGERDRPSGRGGGECAVRHRGEGRRASSRWTAISPRRCRATR